MQLMQWKIRVEAPLVWLLAVCLALPSAAAASTLGRTDFANSGAPEAQESFIKGLLLLHSFEYTDARDSFREAQGIDPDFAMAYWGEAMTHNHPLWLEEALGDARESLARLGDSPAARRAKAPTEREKAYLDAVELLFGDGDKKSRDLSYAAAMKDLMHTYPEDLDAASFYALALLGTCHDGRETAIYMQAAAVVEEVFAANPLHPGAAHYLIHSYDDPVHAPLGLRSARVYAQIAPSAEHALHMPSHIFLPLGMWEETAAANVASYEAAEERRLRRGLGVDSRGFHAMQWLHYAYLQMGEIDKARALLELITEDNQMTNGRRARGHLALMRGSWAAETGRWDDLPPGPDLGDLSPNQVASDLFATGLAALGRGDVDAAQETLDDLVSRFGSSAAGGEAGSQCHSTSGTTSSNTSGYSSFGEVRRGPARITELQLEALILQARGRLPEALAAIAKATELEEQESFGFGPPVPVKPSHELYGELLLASGNAEAARVQFERAQQRAPKRFLTVQGLLTAARHLGDEASAEKAAELLQSIRPGRGAARLSMASPQPGR